MIKKTLITICARGGSKGVPNKNIRTLGTLPLIAYTINIAKKFSIDNEVDIELSTDSILIKNTCEYFGITSEYLRPPHLATDQAGKIDVIRDLIRFAERKNSKEYDYILDLDVSSPLRTINDLIESKRIFEEKDFTTLFSVSEAEKNPYFNMVELDNQKKAFLSKDRKNTYLTRQNAPKVYQLNASFYWYKRDFFKANTSSPITNNSGIYIMPNICFDIDNEIDFEFMNFLLNTHRLNFMIS